MFSSEKWLAKSGDFFNGVATQSLRYNDPDNAYLSRTPSSASNRKTWIYSTWFKIANTNTSHTLFSGGSASSGRVALYLSSDGKFTTDLGQTGVYDVSVAVFRDPSAWYHLVWAFDATQGTGSKRSIMYINGTEITLTKTRTWSNADYAINSADLHTMGGFSNSVNALSNDLYQAETNFVDGLSFFSDTSATPNTSFNVNSFGETKNGVWIPIKYSGSYGTNGFRLQFASTTHDAPASEGNAETDNIGADSSGENNHWTASDSIDTEDCAMPDSPENNFATLNVLDKRGTVTITEGSLKADLTANGNITATIAPTSGKWYWECYLNDVTNPYIGVQSIGTAGSSATGYSQDAVALNSAGDIYYDGGSQSGAFEGSPAWSNTNILSVAYDVDNNKIWWALNGQFYSANASSESTIAYSVVEAGNSAYDLSSQVTHGVAFLGSSASNGIVTMNFGQDASFAGELTDDAIGDKKDGNGNGLFKYAPPSGYLALCTNNLPEPTISPNADTQADDHFNTILYNGDGQTTQNVTGVGFAPDWTWIKERSSTSGHVLADSSRGYDKFLTSNETIAEGTGVLNSRITTGNGGFQTTNSGATNQASQTYVAWNWLAGGLTPSKTYKVKVVSDSTDFGHGTGSNKYQFFKSDGSTGFGTNGVDLDLQEGGTYTFDWSDSSAQSHPIRFSLTNDGTHSSGTSGGSEYTTGVVKNDSAYTTTITVASGVANLYYYCQSHSGMGAEVRTNATSGQTNFDGSILSVSNANPKAGFSIITWTNTASNNQTIGHGLGASPTFLITKSRTPSGIWAVGTSASSFNWANDYYKWVDTDKRRTDGNGTVFGAVPDDNVFTFGTGIGGNNVTFVSYCFAEVEGYSRFGSYTANGSNDGTFVFTGFDISFLMIKRSSATSAYSSWTIYDNKRKTINSDVGTDSNPLFANKTSQEGIRGNGSLSISGTRTSVDFLSNGFKTRDVADEIGVSNNTYIYMCWAKTPFKYATAK